MPVLDFAVACPEGEVDRFGGSEDFSEGGDVDGLHGAWGLVERAVEGVVKDVLGVFEGLGDAVASVLVLEFEGVGGVVGIADLGGDVGDDYWG